VTLEGLNDQFVDRIGGTLILLLSAVALLLVIGCGNVSILLLAGHGASARTGGPVGNRCRTLSHSAAVTYGSADAVDYRGGHGVALAYGLVKVIVKCFQNSRSRMKRPSALICRYFSSVLFLRC